jgi:hypothetical protein
MTVEPARYIVPLPELLAENRAVYLPAITYEFARSVHTGARQAAWPIPADHLNFLDPLNPVFHYPVALLSAGQVQPRLGDPIKPCIVTQRDRSATVILGDSGGYQIQTGKLPFNANTPLTMMRWMEQVSDWSMVLDFPTGGIAGGALRPHVKRLKADGHNLDAMSAANGLSVDYNACLLQTKINNDIFVQQRQPGATKFLNVLQGRTERESRHWYENVRHYPFEGWAFAGGHQNHFSLLLSRLLDMRDDGTLQNLKWLHVLGVSDLEQGLLLTVVQRAVRQHVNPEFQISFDSSSPFLQAAKKGIATTFTVDDKGWASQFRGYKKLPTDGDDLLLSEYISRLATAVENRLVHVADTHIARTFTLGDLRSQIGELDDEGKVKMDSSAYALLMNHNTEAMVRSHLIAHRAFFDRDLELNPPLASLKHSIKTPMRVLVIAEMIAMLFEGRGFTGTPQQAALEWAPQLDILGKL